MRKVNFINYLLVLIVIAQLFLFIKTLQETNLIYQQLFSALIVFFLLLILALVAKQNELKNKIK